MKALPLIISIVSAVISLGSAYLAWRASRPLPDLVSRITWVWHLGRFPGVRGLLLHFQVTNRALHPIQLLSYHMVIQKCDGTEVTLPVMWGVGDVSFTVEAGDIFHIQFSPEQFYKLAASGGRLWRAPYGMASL